MWNSIQRIRCEQCLQFLSNSAPKNKVKCCTLLEMLFFLLRHSVYSTLEKNCYMRTHQRISSVFKCLIITHKVLIKLFEALQSHKRRKNFTRKVARWSRWNDLQKKRVPRQKVKTWEIRDSFSLLINHLKVHFWIQHSDLALCVERLNQIDNGDHLSFDITRISHVVKYPKLIS